MKNGAPDKAEHRSRKSFCTSSGKGGNRPPDTRIFQSTVTRLSGVVFGRRGFRNAGKVPQSGTTPALPPPTT
jgi:hypothetical protein